MRGDFSQMKKVKWFIPFIALAAVLILISCGDDENPADPGNNPTASTLSATSGTTNAVAASWTTCPDTDFSEYNLYRSTTSGISSNPPSSSIMTTTTVSDTTYTDIGLSWGETYYYALQTKNTDNNVSWSNEMQVVIADSGSGGDYLTCYEIQGQQSSSPYLDQDVTVAGIVTAGGDEYYSSSGPVAVLGDPAGGPWTGLVVFGDSIASLARGDSVIISGTVQEFFGLTELSIISAVEIVSTGNDLPPATAVTTANIANSQNPEQYESVLVTVSNAIVTEVQTYGEFLVDDGTGECRIDDMGDYSYVPAVGDTLITATGTMWYDWDVWKLEPRDDADLVTSGGGGDAYTCYEIQGQQSSSPFDGQTVSVTGIVVVGGDEYYSSSAAYSVIMDASGGAWHGLTLFGTDVSSLNRGDSVTVTGEITEYYGLTELHYPSSVVVHSTGHSLPSPELLDTDDVGQEQWESVLVSVSDVTVTEDDLGYGEWAVDDGSGEIRIDDLGDYTYSASIGDTFTEIIGVVMYSFDNWKMEPRTDDDLTI